ncbi:MAG: ABC transporter substrate-binding protein [Clostridia bacterium]|nr:ABC transporter substrate-binding protein [Clostridia bacterium]
MKKLISLLLVITFVGGLIGLTGCGTKGTETATNTEAAANKEKLEKIRIGADSAAFSLQFRVAKAKGFFEKNGIDADVQTFSFGIDTLNAAVLGQVDTAEGMDYATASRLAKGPLKVVGLINTPKEKNGELFVKGNISKPEDLKGKKIGVAKGTVNEYIWARLLEKYNISEKEVTLEYLQSAPEILAAIERGDIEAAFFDGANKVKAAKVEDVKSIGDYSLIGFRQRGYFTIQESIVKDKPEVVVNILKALDEATQYLKEHPEEAADIAFKELKLPKDAVLKEIKENWDYEVRFTQEDYNHLKEVYEWSNAKGLIKEKFDSKDKIDIEPLKKALPNKDVYKP